MAILIIVNIDTTCFYFRLNVEQNKEKQRLKLFWLGYIDKILSKFYLNKAYIATRPIKELIIL